VVGPNLLVSLLGLMTSMWYCAFSLGQLIKIFRETQMELVVDGLTNFSVGKDNELRVISSLGGISRSLAHLTI
jgi:hypothetical protein